MADKITVCIEIDEAGQVTVGAEPPEADDQGAAMAGSDDNASGATGMTDLAQPPASEEDAEKSYMQPVKSIDEALSVARDLLRNAAQVGGATMGGEPGGAGAQSAADAAFKSRRGGKAPMGM